MFATLLVIVLAGLAGPLIAIGPRPLVPTVVGEIVAGAILGRTGFGIIDPATPANSFLYTLGFAMLMLVAGSHVQLRGPALASGARSAAVAFAVVVALALPVGIAIGMTFAPSAPAPLFPVLLAGSSAAVAFPILKERGLLGPQIALLIAWIPIADAVTVLLMPLTLVGASKIPTALAGDAFIVVATFGALVLGLRFAGNPLALTLRDLSRSREWALQLRIALLLLVGLSFVASETGGSTLLAGFGAGLVLARLQEPERLEVQLSGLAEGFFVPAFFVLLGSELDFRALGADQRAVFLALLMAAAAISIHLVAGRVATPRSWSAYGLAASAQLGLPAAAASLGLATGSLSPSIAAAIVAAGCLTVLPASIGTRRLAASLSAEAAPGDTPSPAPVAPASGGSAGLRSRAWPRRPSRRPR
jgi:Kef-type K+ transport systems, membrane components